MPHTWSTRWPGRGSTSGCVTSRACLRSRRRRWRAVATRALRPGWRAGTGGGAATTRSRRMPSTSSTGSIPTTRHSRCWCGGTCWALPGGCHRSLERCGGMPPGWVAACARRRCLSRAIARERSVRACVDRDFLAVVVELPRLYPPGISRLSGEQFEAGPGFVPALLHRQFQVEPRAPAPVVGDPLGHAGGHPARLLDHVADHPVQLLPGLPAEAVLAHVSHPPGGEQLLAHGTVVHRGDHHSVAGKYPAPAA